MKFGVHLPLIGFSGSGWSLAELREYVRVARQLGFTSIAANDHLVFRTAWLDGPTALAAVLGETGDMDLMTTVTLPVVRGPVQTAKTLAAIDVLSGGRLTVGVGPGSSEADYRAVGVGAVEARGRGSARAPGAMGWEWRRCVRRAVLFDGGDRR